MELLCVETCQIATIVRNPLFTSKFAPLRGETCRKNIKLFSTRIFFLPLAKLHVCEMGQSHVPFLLSSIHATFALCSSQENVGEDHLALKLAGEVLETGLWGPTTVGPRLLGVRIPRQLRLPDDRWHHGCDATPVRMKH